MINEENTDGIFFFLSQSDELPNVQRIKTYFDKVEGSNVEILKVLTNNDCHMISFLKCMVFVNHYKLSYGVQCSLTA